MEIIANLSWKPELDQQLGSMPTYRVILYSSFACQLGMEYCSDWSAWCQYNVTGCGIMSRVYDVLSQSGSAISAMCRHTYMLYVPSVCFYCILENMFLQSSDIQNHWISLCNCFTLNIFVHVLIVFYLLYTFKLFFAIYFFFVYNLFTDRTNWHIDIVTEERRRRRVNDLSLIGSTS